MRAAGAGPRGGGGTAWVRGEPVAAGTTAARGRPPPAGYAVRWTASATAAAVMPSFSSTTSPGAEAP